MLTQIFNGTGDLLKIVWGKQLLVQSRFLTSAWAIKRNNSTITAHYRTYMIYTQNVYKSILWSLMMTLTSCYFSYWNVARAIRQWSNQTTKRLTELIILYIEMSLIEENRWLLRRYYHQFGFLSLGILKSDFSSRYSRCGKRASPAVVVSLECRYSSLTVWVFA